MFDGKRVLQRRKQLGISQEDLALLVGVSQHQISKYERNANNPRADILEALSDALQTTTDYLLQRTDVPKRPLRGEGDLDDLEREILRIIRSTDIETRKKLAAALKALV